MKRTETREGSLILTLEAVEKALVDVEQQHADLLAIRDGLRSELGDTPSLVAAHAEWRESMFKRYGRVQK